MDVTSVATLIGAMGLSGIVAALINFYANRERVGADATKIITDAATSVVSSLRERIEELEAREDARDKEDERVREAARRHEEWDRKAVSLINGIVPPIHLDPPPPLYPRPRPWDPSRGRGTQES